MNTDGEENKTDEAIILISIIKNAYLLSSLYSADNITIFPNPHLTPGIITGTPINVSMYPNTIASAENIAHNVNFLVFIFHFIHSAYKRIYRRGIDVRINSCSPEYIFFIFDSNITDSLRA